MTCSKPEYVRDEVWDQHLRWLDLVRDECKSNQVKYQRERRRQKEVAERGPQR